MDKYLLLVVCSFVTFTNGQLDRPYETGIGFIDGRRVFVDETADQRFRDVQPLRTRRREMLGSVTADNFFGPFDRNSFDRSGFGRDGIGRSRIRPCRALVCTLEFIPAECRYTPVLQTGFGDYCLGCPEDICERQRQRLTPRQRRRRRRIRRRLCRNFGMCFGQRSGNPLGIAIP